MSDPFVQRVQKTKRIVSGTDIIPHPFLLKESSELATQAFMEITPTPKAKPRADKAERSGMMLKAAVPLFDESNEFRGALLGGVLINRNFEIVDKIIRSCTKVKFTRVAGPVLPPSFKATFVSPQT